GGPMPNPSSSAQQAGYFGLPFLKGPVWEWMIAVYFFVGGIAGMSGLVAAAALIKHEFALARIAMWSAGIGAILSIILLTADLGRPIRFIYMLRVFKYQSPMSVGSWILSAFSAFAIPGLGFAEWHYRNVLNAVDMPIVHAFAVIGMIGAGLFGIFLATYTGALIGATVIPAWNTHRALLPLHFGMAGLGAAVAVPQLLGFREPALVAIFFLAASAETLVQIHLTFRRRGAVDAALHHGTSGWLMIAGETLSGPLPLILAGLSVWPAANISFLLGALITRFGWLAAGRASACNPESVLASETGAQPAAQTRAPYVLDPAIASVGSLKKT
ncbi:MAG: NrfD/PsrC family molybdoenzyme membrane anchor subunit, partial [Limisphaerales bacterium]